MSIIAENKYFAYRWPKVKSPAYPINKVSSSKAEKYTLLLRSCYQSADKSTLYGAMA